MDVPKIDSPLVQDHINKSTEDIRKKISTGEITTLQELRLEVFSRYIAHFTELKSRNFEPQLYGIHDYRSYDIWNNNQLNIRRTIQGLYSETRDLNNSLLAQHNLLAQTAEDVLNKSRNAQARLNAIRETIETRQFFDQGKSIIVLEDSFTDTRKVDFSQTTDVLVDQSISAVLLSTASNVARGSSVVNIEVITNKDADSDPSTFVEDGLPKKPRAYEGNRFDFLGQARPQTGAWRIEAKNTLIDKASPDIERVSPLSSNYKYYLNLKSEVFGTPDEILDAPNFTLKDTEGKRITPNKFLFDDRAVGENEKEWTDETSDEFSKTITRDDFVYVETLPTPTQLKNSILKMVDSDPNSFWEIEYTPVFPELANVLNGSGSYQEYQLLTNNHLANNSTEDLTITLTVTLDNAYFINYIDLTPFFFSSEDEANYEVTEILTKESDSSPLIGIQGFDRDFDNVIGRNTNSTLTNEQMENAGVFNRFVFKSKGFWSFEKRKVKVLKITIKQSVALPNPYQLKMVQLLKKSNYSISQSKTTGKTTKDMFVTTVEDKAGSGNILERGRVTQLVQFGYLETILAALESASTGLLAGASSGNSFELSKSNNFDDRVSGGTGGVFTLIGGHVATGILAASTPTPVITPEGGGTTVTNAAGNAFAGAIGTLLGAALDDALTQAGGTRSTDSLSKSYNDSGFQINKEFTRTIWSRGRYAIGIRELGLYSKTYVGQGVVTSSPYQVLAGDKKLTLEVDHKVPLQFTDFNEATAWIEYYIIINDTSIRLRPERMPPPELPHVDYPAHINLKDYGGEGELLQIRFRAVIKRPPESTLLNADSDTPLLKGYKIIIE